jgi:hypothetical protein
MFNALSDISLVNNDYCFLMEDTNLYSETFKVYIPKFMPFFNKEDKPKEIRITIDKNIFINSKDCAPQITNTEIITQNYIKVKKLNNSQFKFQPQTLLKNTRFVCKTFSNPQDIYITDQNINNDQVTKPKSVFIMNPIYEILNKINVGDKVQVVYNSGLTLNTQDCIVLSKHNWGIIANVNGSQTNILPNNILGVYKDPNEFYK